MEFRYRNAGRSDKLLPLEVTSKITVRKNSKKVDFETCDQIQFDEIKTAKLNLETVAASLLSMQ